MSALASLLVHLDASPRAEERLRVALALARDHDAELTALYAVSSIAAEFPFAVAGNPEATASLLDAEAAIRARARAGFDRVVAEFGRQPAWAEVDLEPERAVARQARYADLVVLGQQEPGETSMDGLSRHFVASVLLDSGRAGLVVPYAYAAPPSSSPGKVALVGWKNTREAARAVGASLPLLRRAGHVHVASWAEEGGDDAGPLDIAHYLRRHGVDATMHRREAASSDVGESLLSLAADLGADLLVMGCYGHGRAREWVLGGATRSILRSMTIPVVMAH